MHEKASQVNIMGQIFGGADAVVIWLGGSNEYWSRCWIVQEFALARKLFVQSGISWIAWDEYETEKTLVYLQDYHSVRSLLIPELPRNHNDRQGLARQREEW